LLVRLANPEDADAWNEFAAIYQAAIYRYSRGRGLQDSDALEVVQDVLLAVHQEIGNWSETGRPGAFRAWIMETARRVCLKAIRNRGRADRAGIAQTDVSSLEEISERSWGDERRDWERWAFCWAAGQIEREVEPLRWRAFWLTAVEGLPAAEVAARLDMKIGTVYATKCRIIAKIRARVLDLSTQGEV
jgi:RNA polymerase sigma-70 factor (ECF subfamily)